MEHGASSRPYHKEYTNEFGSNIQEGDCHFMPFIRTVQRIVLYMTKSRMYIVGSNNMENKFRVLKIDRTEPRELRISDDKMIYSQREIRELLVMIDTGNRSKSSNQKIGNGLQR